MKDFGGAGVLELIEDHRSDTYRAVYTVKFATRIYVLHAFRRNRSAASRHRSGSDLIRERLKWAERLHTVKVKEG